MHNLLLALIVATAACAGTARTQLALPECQRAMALFQSGESMAQIASELHLESRDQARKLVHDAMISVARRYYTDRYR